MRTSYIHYVRRRIIDVQNSDDETARFSEEQFGSAGFERPVFHKTFATSGPTARVKEGDIIWIISRLTRGRQSLPVSLDARIIVEKVEKVIKDGRCEGHRFIAGKKSRWFPLCNAETTLRLLETANGKGEVTKLWPATIQKIGTVTQQMRQLQSDHPLRELEQSIVKDGYDFVSYRQCDGTASAFDYVQSRLTSGGIVWWDRWSLPRRLAERREEVSTEALDGRITSAIQDAKRVQGIWSPRYEDVKSYSMLEL
ncbi:MAG: hypothetical protein C0622_04975 [Desulfuromonas sp.]|nr:MAG: hypothetical protein C0622_04975 [Desulfuromonas sp.]